MHLQEGNSSMEGEEPEPPAARDCLSLRRQFEELSQTDPKGETTLAQ